MFPFYTMSTHEIPVSNICNVPIPRTFVTEKLFSPFLFLQQSKISKKKANQTQQ